MLRKFSECQVDRGGGGASLLSACVIEDVAYLRETARSWTDWAAGQSRLKPLFNWVSIFNFNAAASTSVLCLDHDGAQALMKVRDGHVVRCDANPRASLVYVGFLEVAPWNNPSIGNRLFAGLGPTLLRVACDLSLTWGCRGRIGLHSVPSAEAFHRRLGFRSLDCPNEYHELYFELDEGGAQVLLGG